MSRARNDALFGAHVVLATLRTSIRFLRWAMLGLVLFYLCSGLTVIGPGDSGLILRLGKLQPEIHRPGLLWALPEPLDQVVRVPTNTLQEIALDAWATKPIDSDSPTLHPINSPYTLTGDANIIRADFSVRYQISDPVNYVYRVKDNAALLQAVLYQAACRTLAAMPVDDVLSTRKDFLSSETVRLAQDEITRLGLGVQLLAFEIRQINPPDVVLSAFQDVVSAKVEAKTLVEPANSYRASALPRAQADGYRLGQEADAYAAQITAQAQGEAHSFLAQLAEYRAHPAVVRTRLAAETLEAVLPKMRVSTVLPAGLSPATILVAPQKADGTQQTTAPDELSEAPNPSNPAPPASKIPGYQEYKNPASVPGFKNNTIPRTESEEQVSPLPTNPDASDNE